MVMVWYGMVGMVWYGMVCAVLYFIVLHCIVWYCIENKSVDIAK